MNSMFDFIIRIYSYRTLSVARQIVEGGGDPNPCDLGHYCLRCCIALAKGQVDTHRALPDEVLILARDAVAVHDKGIAHSQETAVEAIIVAQHDDYSLVHRLFARFIHV